MNNNIKEIDKIKIQVMSRNTILEETNHVVESDDKGLFVIRKGFKLYLKDINESNNIIKIKNDIDMIDSNRNVTGSCDGITLFKSFDWD